MFRSRYTVTQLNSSCDFCFQVLASDMSDKNREACAAATKPLIDSVESLTAYALSPEFAPVPAKISDEVRKRFWSRLHSQLWVVHTVILSKDNGLSFCRHLRTVTLILSSLFHHYTLLRVVRNFTSLCCFNVISILAEIRKQLGLRIIAYSGTGGKTNIVWQF